MILLPAIEWVKSGGGDSKDHLLQATRSMPSYRTTSKPKPTPETTTAVLRLPVSIYVGLHQLLANFDNADFSPASAPLPPEPPTEEKLFAVAFELLERSIEHDPTDLISRYRHEFIHFTTGSLEVADRISGDPFDCVSGGIHSIRC